MKRWVFAVSLGCALAPALLHAQAAAAASEPALAPSLVNSLDRIAAGPIEAHVRFLASDAMAGRATPSPELDRAAAYIAGRFEAAGLAPAGPAGYFQDDAFVQVQPVLEGFRMVYEQGGERLEVASGQVAVDNRGAVSLDHAKVRLVEIGPGEAGDAGGDAVAGRVLLVRMKAQDQRTYRRLLDLRRSARGAAAVVVLLNRRPGGTRPSLRPADDETVPWVAVSDEALAKAVDALAPGDLDASMTLHIAAAKQAPFTLRNVAGLLRGSDPALRDTYVVVSAHYDHQGIRGSGEDPIYNGANDNASGTAGLLELAAVFAAGEWRPRRSLLFVAFSGEEAGLLGSRMYVRQPLVPLARTVANVNLEQIGRTDDNEGPQLARANVTGFGFSDLPAVFVAAGRLTGIDVNGRGEVNERYFVASDNLPFAQAGIPAHTISVTYQFPDYHRPGDEAAKLDYANMARVLRMIGAGVALLADSAQAPKWNQDNPKAAPYGKARQEAR